MPYIKSEKRSRLQPVLDAYAVADIKNPGELTYLLTMLTHRYLNQQPENYQFYNDCLGALEATKLELYRRHVASYEDDKMKENGDI